MKNLALTTRGHSPTNDEATVAATLSDLQAQIAGLADAQKAQATMLADLRVRSTPILSHAEDLNVVTLPCNVPHPIFNASMLGGDDEMICMSRSSTLRNIRDKILYYASLPHDTINIIHKFDHGMTLRETSVLDDSLLRNTCPSAKYGVEDCRLFLWKNELWAIGAGVSPSEAGGLLVTQILFKIETDRVTEFFELPSPFNRVEKNWIPYVKNDLLFLVYSFIPTIVYEFRDGKIALAFSTNEAVNAYFSIRGGTTCIPWNGGVLAVVHESPITIDRHYYRHMFIFLDESLRVLELGEPWFIRKRGIEFACGLTRFRDKIFMSFGLSDRHAGYCELPSETIDRWIVT